MDCLTGIRMEATEPPETALQYYDKLLEVDSANAVRPSSPQNSVSSIYIVYAIGHMEKKDISSATDG